MAYLFTNNSGEIYRADLAGNTRLLADFSQTFTDIAIAPSGTVYTVSFGTLYRLDGAMNTATAVASLSGGINGMGIGSDGRIYLGGQNNEITVLSGKTLAVVDRIDLPDGIMSAGDIHILGDTLYYSTANARLLSIDLDTGAVTRDVYHGVINLFGLYTQQGVLYGMASDDLYRLNPATGTATWLREMPVAGVIYGSASLAGVTVRGGAGDNAMRADINGSTLLGFGGDDTLNGNAGRDRLVGGDGRDHLNGAAGADRLEGGTGRDRLEGGAGADTPTGGEGDDVFVLRSGMGRDRITDFLNDHDSLHIARGLATGAGSVRALLADYGDVTAAGVVLDFGTRGEVVLAGLRSLSALADDIVLI